MLNGFIFHLARPKDRGTIACPHGAYRAKDCAAHRNHRRAARRAGPMR
jgi:hypothetical protein